MFPVGRTLNARQKQLLGLFDGLDAAAQEQLLAFAEFLSQRDAAAPVAELPQPEPIARPENESVVAAIRRLSQTYHMIDKDRVLNKTSELMSAHLLQGRPADSVIDELEQVFLRYYQQMVDEQPRDAD